MRRIGRRERSLRRITYARGMPHDVVIIGGGHNGLTAAAYLARAGRSVLLLERDDHLGGAAVSAQAFEGVDARLSRYSYLVSLLPQRIIDDLGLDVRLVRRRFSSYTPDPDRPRARPAHRPRGAATRHPSPPSPASAPSADAAAWSAFYADTARARRAALPDAHRAAAHPRRGARARGRRSRLGATFVERPLGERHRRALHERPRARRRRDRRPHRHVHRPRRPRRSTRTAASSTT